MNPIFQAAADVQTFCIARRFAFCFIGGLAVQRWGEPRLTVDVDLTLLTGFGNEEPFVDAMLDAFSARRDDARDFALRYRVILLATTGGIPVDVSLGAMPFEERAVRRATPFDIGHGASLLTCSAEDLVVHKVFAGRDRDWADVRGILERQAARLDVALVLDELRPLLALKGDDDAEARLLALLAGG